MSKILKHQYLTTGEEANNYPVRGKSFMFQNNGNTTIVLNNNVKIPPTGAWGGQGYEGYYYDELMNWKFDATGVANPVNYLTLVMTRDFELEQQICKI